MGKQLDTKKKIQKRHVAHKLAAFMGAFGLLLCAGGCGLMEDDFFTYAPKSHIITKEEEVDAYRNDVLRDNGQRAVPEDAGKAEPDTKNVQAGNENQEERLVGNVEYDESDEQKEKGIVRDMPFVYRGVSLSYTGDPEVDLAVAEQVGRPVPATVTKTVEQGREEGQEEEPPLKLGTVGFNGEFYEGHLKYDNEFIADITIAYSEAGTMNPGAAVEIQLPVEREYTDDDDDDWVEPVRIMLCDAIPGKNGRIYAIVRNREGGSLDLLQYSYDYKNAAGEVCHIRVIASFFGGASEAQGVDLLDRLDFKYVGENVGL